MTDDLGFAEMTSLRFDDCASRHDSRLKSYGEAASFKRSEVMAQSAVIKPQHGI